MLIRCTDLEEFVAICIMLLKEGVTFDAHATILQIQLKGY